MMDVHLRMDEAVDHIVAVARPKIKALLRSKGSYSLADMLTQYKTHIWGITEYANGAILHASETALNKLDNLQRSFLRELHMTEEEAFLEFNFAPSALRRDIGILGFLQKRVLNLCHPGIYRFLPMSHSTSQNHNKQISYHLDQCICRHQLYFRSLFSKVIEYNRLPQRIVDSPSVKAFQSELTRVARHYCKGGSRIWQNAFRNEVEVWKVMQTLI